MASFIVYGDASGQVTVKAPNVAGTNTITFPAETGTLITSASTTMPNTILWDTTVKTSGFTAVAYGGYFCNTTSSAFTVTLPATPTRGQFVVIVDYAGTSASNNITVSGNGANIKGTSSNAILSTNRQGITFTYIDSTQGWVASSNVYGGSTPFTQPYTATYLVVAGGGSGSTNGSGGGGAGGLLTGTLTLQPGTVYTAVVGGGGAGSTSTPRSAGSNGSNSTFPGVTTAIGGGVGGYGFPVVAAGSGGSGGGGAIFGGGGGSGTPGQGNNGGSATPSGPNPYSGGAGGGGGAGAVGSNGTTNVGGAGGVGLANSITGTPAFYAGGGGGNGGSGAPAAPGGNGGGGVGGVRESTAGGSGTANTGGGGGGTDYQAGGGSGGSGVVILSVPTSSYPGTTTGSPTITTSGSNTIIKWTSGSGTYTA